MKRLILLAAVIFSWGTYTAQAQQTSQNSEEQIDEILKQLTLEEKVKMCHAQSKFSSPGVPRLGIPEIWMSDGPHGVRAEISWDEWKHAGWTNDSCTAFPALTCLAATFNPAMAHKYGVAIGEEARYRKKDILLGPGVNIYRTPLNGRNFEYMGEDPYLASVMAVPYIKGVQSNGVAACVKHYVLNNQELWRGHINAVVSPRALHEIYLPAFKAAVEKADVWSLMGAYNKYLGQWCCHNKVLVNDILKGDWAFDGVLVTDWGATHDTFEAAVNGVDIEMGTGTNGLTTSSQNAYDYYFLAKPFLKLIKSGQIDESVVDDKVRRILRLMLRTTMDRSRPLGSMASQDHFDVARKVAQEGIVLLKNNNDILPLDANTTQTIAVIGENATRMMTIGGGSSELKAVHEISPLQGIKKSFSNARVVYSMGYSSGAAVYGRETKSDLDADSLRQAAVELCRKADIVLYVGGLNKNHGQDCEGIDRKHYNLPYSQDELLNQITSVNKNVAVILVSGNAVAMPWLSKVKAVLQTWYLGSEAGNALADVLTGDVTPSGKLPFSFPKKLEDCPAHAFDSLAYPGDNVDVVYKEDILVGYRWYDTKKIEPLFEFGFGLSYTKFKIDNAITDRSSYKKTDEITLSLDLSNVGDTKGAEVVQVYVNDVKSSVLRPAKELKAFRKVMVHPGETRTVKLKIPVSSLAFYDEVEKEWRVEPGKYKLLVGVSSRKIEKEIAIRVDK